MAIGSKKRNFKIARQKKKIRESVWPDIDDSQLWHYRSTAAWLSVPRTMPLILRIADSMAPRGKPVSQTYFDLWCRTYDDGFVIVTQPREMAFYSGFSGERAVHTWTTRMKILEEFGFISVRPGPNGPMNYVLVINPFHVIQDRYDEEKVDEALMNALRARLVEVRATDIEEYVERK